MTEPDARSFERFVGEVGERLERALVAAYGFEVGVDAAAEAMAVAWERWPEVAAMSNPAGFLYRVGQSKARPQVRWTRRRNPFTASVHAGLLDSPGAAVLPDSSAAVADLAAAVGRLRLEQRVAVLAVKAWGFSYAETAELLDISEAAVGNHVRRGLAALRRTLGDHR